VTPDEDVFYLVAFLRSAQSLEELELQNRQIFSEAGIGAKQYLPSTSAPRGGSGSRGSRPTFEQGITYPPMTGNIFSETTRGGKGRAVRGGGPYWTSGGGNTAPPPPADVFVSRGPPTLGPLSPAF
jgi:hypothetical protein